MAFRVGQKVCCVYDGSEARPTRGLALKHGLKAGADYTITKIISHGGYGDFFTLAEVVGCGWHHSRFRPVVERKSDISIFTAMLHKPPVRKREKA